MKGRVVAALVAGGVLGGLLAWNLPSKGKKGESPSPPGKDPVQPSPEAVPGDSYYLKRYRKGEAAVSKMTPLLLTPREDDHASPSCPPELVVLCPEAGYGAEIRPLLEALGSLDLGKEAVKASPTASDSIGRLDEYGRILRSIADGPAGTPPLRVLFKHYPRPELPGRCITIHASFYTVADLYFDPKSQFPAMEPNGATHGKNPVLHGFRVEIRRTVQLDVSPPRLIEASATVLTQIAVSRAHGNFASASTVKEVRAIGGDVSHAAHFDYLAARSQEGACWYDLSHGLGTRRRSWSRAFRIIRPRPDRPAEVKTTQLPPAVVEALLRLASRL